MKLWLRIAISAVGVGFLVLGWLKAHADVANLQFPAKANMVRSSELLVMIGGFVMLMAFAPSQKTLARWTALKKPKKARQAQFRRRRQRS